MRRGGSCCRSWAVNFALHFCRRVTPAPLQASHISVPVGVFSRSAANIRQVENDDYCSACGGNGDLICCDSCSKSFHFECVDLVGSAELPDDWFCNDCIYKRSPQRPDHRGPFGPLLNLLEKTIPRAFSLPKKVQACFEDIKAGVNGEYEEIDRTKTSRYVRRCTGHSVWVLITLQEREESRVRLVPAA